MKDTDDSKHQPCINYENGSCDCFDAHDHHKGGAIYWFRPTCEAWPNAEYEQPEPELSEIQW